MPPTLANLARSLLLDGDELMKAESPLAEYYRRLEVSPSTVASATQGLGMGRVDDQLRVLVSRRSRGEPPVALGPSAGVVLGVSVGFSSIRAALVDANGWTYHQASERALIGQLRASPNELFDRIKAVGETVLTAALSDERLLVRGALPFLGLAVAWPGPLDRDKRFPRIGLAHPLWRANDYGIDQRLARHLRLPVDRSFAIDNGAAAALAVAFDYTRSLAYREQRDRRPILVVRIGGELAAASIVIDPVRDGDSGWATSVLAEGERGLAGQIGHMRVNRTLLQELEASRPDDCPTIQQVPCSCADTDASPDHVEAFASCPALAERFAHLADGDLSTAIRLVRAKEAEDPYRYALHEIGALIGDCLVAAVLMENPHHIVLTGGLAVEKVRKSIEQHLEQATTLGRVFGGVPAVSIYGTDENDYIRVRGAALSVMRRRVHSRLDDLFGAERTLLERRFHELTLPLEGCPWL